jgi:hypothetical protein
MECLHWQKNSCYPCSTTWRATKPNMVHAPAADGYAGHFRVMTAKNGKQFGWGMSDYSNMLYMRVGDVFKPIAGTIRVAFGQYGGGLRYPVMKDLYEKTKAGAFLWQDANDDQTIQEEELAVSPAGRGESVFNWIDGDLNAWCDAGWIYYRWWMKLDAGFRRLFTPQRTPQQYMLIAVSSEDADARRDAVTQIARSKQSKAEWAIKGFVAIAQLESDPQARCVAIRALARTGDPRAVETVLKILNHREYPPQEVWPPDALCLHDAATTSRR